MLGQDARVSSVYALAEAPDGTIYAGTGPEGLLLQIKDNKVTTAAELGDNLSIFSLLVDSQGRLLIGTGGEKGQIFRIDQAGAKPQAVFSADGVQYVWAMLQAADGTLYAATGPNGQLFQINPDGSHKVLYDSEENNLLSMTTDGKDTLYFGTDPNGLVFRIDRKTGQVFVLYDAAETEVSALAIDAQGNVYAGTAQSSESETGGPTEAQPRGGRPESETTGIPIPSEQPSAPTPPEVPKPAPGEPLPIPKSHDNSPSSSEPPKRMMILPAQPDGGDAPSTEPSGAIEEPAQTKPTNTAAPTAAQVAAPAASGNAIYKIDPQGFVTEIFRHPVMIFSMLERNGSLIVATGSDGEVWQVNPSAEETSVIAKVDPKQIMCLLPARDGKIYLGLANSGEIGAMSGGFAPTGTYTSAVLDATQISRFGKMHLLGTLPAGATLKLATRSSNVQEAAADGWSPWSDEVSAAEYVPIAAPAARFFQYRLTFTSDDGKNTATVTSVDAAYQLPNLAPQVKSVTVAPPDAPNATDAEITVSHADTISWEASDPNNDAIVYSLYFRAGTRGPWVLIKDKLKETTYEWQTRNVADGTYQVKVEASDEAANPAGEGKTGSRVSDSVIVDNAPPVIGDLKSTVEGTDVKVSLKVVDRTSVVAALSYSVDSSTDWHAVLPSDSIADSPEESYEFTVPHLAAGAHQIMLRALDSHGNPGYESINLTIEKDAAK
jgi:hypothetical protein